MPIRNLIVLAPSGLVLFEKEYSKEKIAQPRLLGSLLTAMTEFATQTTAIATTVVKGPITTTATLELIAPIAPAGRRLGRTGCRRRRPTVCRRSHSRPRPP